MPLSKVEKPKLVQWSCSVSVQQTVILLGSILV